MKIVKRIILVVVIIALGAVYAYGNWPKAVYDVNYDSSATLPELVDDSEVSQQFYCPYSGLAGVKLRFAKLGHESFGEYTWQVIDTESNQVVGEGNVDTEKFSRLGDYKMNFDKISDSKGHTYEFVLKANGVSEEQSLSLYISNAQENAGLVTCNQEEMDANNSLMLKQTIHYFNIETFVAALGILLYLVFFIKLMTKLFN